MGTVDLGFSALLGNVWRAVQPWRDHDREVQCDGRHDHPWCGLWHGGLGEIHGHSYVFSEYVFELYKVDKLRILDKIYAKVLFFAYNGPTTSSITRPVTAAEPRTTSSSTSALPVRTHGQGLQQPGSSSRTSTTSATASSGDREQRERRHRLLREDFVQQWLASSEWFPGEERLRVCTTSEFGECYHLKSDCPGLRNSKKIFRDPVETVILTRKAPCQICCSDHWVLYEAAFL